MSIFDKNDLSDLPPELIKELKLDGEVDSKLLELFQEAGGTLDLSTLLIGYYRKHKETKTRQYMMTACYRLVKKNFLQPTGNKGEYQITSKGKTVTGNNDFNEQSDIEKEDVIDVNDFF